MSRSSRQYVRLRRDQNPNLVFQDISPPAVPGVDLLVSPGTAKVEEVDHGSGQIVLTQSCSFDPCRVVSCNGFPLQVIHHDRDALWVEDMSGVNMGDIVTQTRCTGSTDDLEHEFMKVWRERWMRHADVPAERWSTIVSFVRRFCLITHV